MTDNLDDIYRELFGFQAEGGGDTPESVNAALHGAVHDFEWSDDPKVLRVIFLVGDAPPHINYPDDVKYPESCRLAKAKGIVVNTLQCGNNPETCARRANVRGGSGGSIFVPSQGRRRRGDVGER